MLFYYHALLLSVSLVTNSFSSRKHIYSAQKGSTHVCFTSYVVTQLFHSNILQHLLFFHPLYHVVLPFNITASGLECNGHLIIGFQMLRIFCVAYGICKMKNFIFRLSFA